MQRSTRDPTILSPETSWRVYERADTALLIDGRDYYRAFYAAAMKARRSILLLGWQFDTDVELVRGEDLPPAVLPEDVQLLALLDRLCRERKELEIRVLAWDHSVFFALERELLQKVYIDLASCERFIFRWDNTVPLGGSHHQKVAIIDGVVAFFGSQDICQARWDDSTHRVENEYRTSRGAFHQPYHEVQVALMGDLPRAMVDLFVWRWYGATGERLDPSDLIGEHSTPEPFPVTLSMPRARMGLARTIPSVVGRDHVHEVRDLYVRAIERAEHLVYIESQFLSSYAVRDALVARMRDASRPKLEIVVVLPRKPESFKEVMTVGVPQVGVLQTLEEAARVHGHALGIYNVMTGETVAGEPLYVFIHAKLMIVDDRYFLVGSANLTNRSMTIDSEIVAGYEALSGDLALTHAIRRVRVRLLLEHTGGTADVRRLIQPAGLVSYLDALVASGIGRLRKHDRYAEAPGVLVRAVHELTRDLLDPRDGAAQKWLPRA